MIMEDKYQNGILYSRDSEFRHVVSGLDRSWSKFSIPSYFHQHVIERYRASVAVQTSDSLENPLRINKTIRNAIHINYNVKIPTIAPVLKNESKY